MWRNMNEECAVWLSVAFCFRLPTVLLFDNTQRQSDFFLLRHTAIVLIHFMCRTLFFFNFISPSSSHFNHKWICQMNANHLAYKIMLRVEKMKKIKCDAVFVAQASYENWTRKCARDTLHHRMWWMNQTRNNRKGAKKKVHDSQREWRRERWMSCKIEQMEKATHTIWPP